MERSTARVFAVRQKISLRTVSGRELSSNASWLLSPVTIVCFCASGAVSRYNVERELVAITGY